MPAKDKKLILVRNDLLKEIVKITAKEGKTVFAFTNEIFEQALKAHRMQTNLAEIIEFFELMKLQKDTGAVIIRSDILDYMANKLYEIDEEDLLKKWYNSGLWYGKYLSAKFSDQNLLETFEKLIRLWAWDLTDFSITNRGKKIQVRYVSPRLTSENTNLYLNFLEGILHALNYRTLRNECMKGMILLELEKQKKTTR
ncbi:MAG: hypothetical protein ACE5J6_03135 [Candidatus Bathyarchaeia archaeon]